MNAFDPTQPPRLMAIYIRVSTAEQKREGYSPEHQKKRLLNYIETNVGLNLSTRADLIFMDVGTGNDLNRPSLDKLRKLVSQKAIQGIIVWRIDRLSRNLKHLLMLFEEFQKHDVSFLSLQENIDFTGPIGRLIFQIFGSLAQFERELIRGRTYAGKVTSAEMGNYTRGDTPYGYYKVANKGKGKKLELLADQKQWVETIYDWYVYKGWGDLKISNELNTLKVPIKAERNRRASLRWTEKKVRQILTNSLYSGHFVAFTKDEDGKTLPASEQTISQVPACVSEILFRQAQRVRETRVGGHADHDYILSGKLIDISDDLPTPRKFVGAKRTKGGYSYRRKMIKLPDNGTVISNFELPAEPLEEFVWEKILTAFHNPTAFVGKYLRLNQQNEQIAGIGSKLKSLRLRSKQIEEIEIPNSEKAYLKGIFSEERFSKMQITLNEELEQTHNQIAIQEQELEGLAWVRTEAANIKAASEELSGKLATLTRSHKKMLCGLFVDRVEITRTERPNEKRKVVADIYFRFNLSRLNADALEVCTPVGQSTSAKAPPLGAANAVNGGARRSGYLNARVTASYGKRLKLCYKNGQHYPQKRSFWEEQKLSSLYKSKAG